MDNNCTRYHRIQVRAKDGFGGVITGFHISRKLEHRTILLFSAFSDYGPLVMPSTGDVGNTWADHESSRWGRNFPCVTFHWGEGLCVGLRIMRGNNGPWSDLPLSLAYTAGFGMLMLICKVIIPNVSRYTPALSEVRACV